MEALIYRMKGWGGGSAGVGGGLWEGGVASKERHVWEGRGGEVRTKGH